MASVISTWSFSKIGVEQAVNVLSDDGNATEAVEIGIRAVELDPAVTSAGYGGLPNAAGTLQLDAAIMTSSGSHGAVVALEGFPTAINHARLVMQHSPHPMLAGAGATAFAIEHSLQPSSSLLTPHAKTRYHQFLERAGVPQFHAEADCMPHSDTVGMIARDRSGRITVGCATSGMQFKAVGRVGDSPIIGAGLYADSNGAAVASGDGDKMLRFCLSFLAVERMRSGDTPNDACRYAIARVHDADNTCQAAIAAMAPDGNVGAACTHQGFHTVVWQNGMKEIETRKVSGHVDTKWTHSCV